MLLSHVKHIEHHNHRYLHLNELSRQIQVALQGGCVRHINHQVYLFPHNIPSGNLLFHGIRSQAVNSRQIHQAHRFSLKPVCTLFLFHRHPGPVGNFKLCPCVIVKQRGFAAIRVSHKCYMNFIAHLSPPQLQCLLQSFSPPQTGFPLLLK